MFQVTYPSATGLWFLRSTTWSSDPARATLFATEAEARTALDKARKFMKPAAYKAARIVPASAE